MYFSKFPLVNYNGSVVKNILARVKFNENILDYQTTYYPYTIKDQERFDQLAYNYYDDSQYDWLIYLANEVIDPWYGVPLKDADFRAFIEKKYGSIREARQKILFYRNDWYDDDSNLTVAAYEALTDGRKKYWNPILGFNDQITGYERKRRDYEASTNKIISFNFTATSNNFTYGERVVRNDDANTSAFVVWSNTSVINLQHIIGDFSSNTNYGITGEESGAVATANAETVTTLKQVIPVVETVYYAPVYAYDYEEEKNERNKEIVLVDRAYSEKLLKELKELLNR